MLLVLLACGLSSEPTASSPPPTPAGGPPHPPPPGLDPSVSGIKLQDPSGFPPFHDLPAPQGPSPDAAGGAASPTTLGARPEGGYRPQVAVGADGRLHAVYYDRVSEGEIVRYRSSTDGLSWSSPETVSFPEGRNWGPDLVVREDGSVVVAFDHMNEDLSSRGWVRIRDAAGRWQEPEPVTPDNGWEIGSGHVANTVGDGLVYVYISKPLDPSQRFRAYGSLRGPGGWSTPEPLTDGQQDTWHSNVERRPDASFIAGYDIGQGGMETTLYLVNSEGGRFGRPENVSASGRPGERPNFAFLGGLDVVTWFHKVGGLPTRVYVRRGRPGAWGAVEEPSSGIGGFHFDPDIAVNAAGVWCLVWGWDAGNDAELVYSLDRGQGWSRPRKVAEIDWGKPGLPSVESAPDGSFHVVWNQGVRGQNEVYHVKLGG